MQSKVIKAAHIDQIDVVLEEVVGLRQQLLEKKQGYHKDKETGEEVHSSGKKKNKKFANRTTFHKSSMDALLHTDGDKKGVRGRSPANLFVKLGDKEELEKDPRKKWYPVAFQRGWASAAGSLRQAYGRGKEDADVKKKVMAKVKQTPFPANPKHDKGGVLSPGTIDPTGGLHDERPQCATGSKGERHPGYEYRLCKGTHGAGGENEYQTKYSPMDKKDVEKSFGKEAAEKGFAKKWAKSKKRTPKHAPVGPPADIGDWEQARKGRRLTAPEFKTGSAKLRGQAKAAAEKVPGAAVEFQKGIGKFQGLPKGETSIRKMIDVAAAAKAKRQAAAKEAKERKKR